MIVELNCIQFAEKNDLNVSLTFNGSLQYSAWITNRSNAEVDAVL